ncbi:MAG: type III-A CRISPR-associated protein Csm2 [Acidobacteria bacterium]|nr:type III-A CRISPR-associated protein Csm2 [Acidobacteriota bacterium]
MPEDVQDIAPEPTPEPVAEAPAEAAPEPPAEAAVVADAPAEKPAERPADKPRQQQQRPPREQQQKGKGGDRPRGEQNRPNNKPPQQQQQRDSGPRDRDRGRDRDRMPQGPIEIDYDKLLADSLYLDNQAHAVVARLRDLDAGTRSQLRRLYGAVRRACRAAEGDRQHQFVMLRARLSYTIARHSLRSLDPMEKLLLQVTRKNESKGYDRFRDLFEAIIAYNE